MAKFKVIADKTGGKAWRAEGINPKTGRKMTIRGGQDVHQRKWGESGGKSKAQVKQFLARHGKPKTAKQYINQLNWTKGSQLGKTVTIPNRFFK